MSNVVAKWLMVPVVLVLSMPLVRAGGGSPVNDWENPEVVGRNKEPGHCTLMPYPDVQTALACEREASPYLSVAQWAVEIQLRPQARRPAQGLLQAGLRREQVGRDPRALELGDAWLRQRDLPEHPLPAPDESAVHRARLQPRRLVSAGVHDPGAWDGRQTFLHFDGVQSAFYVWINGQMVGYSEDSMTPAEFNITPYLQKGKNTIAVEVYRWCDGSYLEDQDFIRFSGIQRNVCLFSTPSVHIRDFFVRATLDDQYKDGVLMIRPKLATVQGGCRAQRLDGPGPALRQRQEGRARAAAEHQRSEDPQRAVPAAGQRPIRPDAGDGAERQEVVR